MAVAAGVPEGAEEDWEEAGAVVRTRGAGRPAGARQRHREEANGTNVAAGY